MNVANTHKCPAKACSVQVPLEVLACKRHWFALPPALRHSISRTWRQGELEAWAEWRKHAVAILNGA